MPEPLSEIAQLEPVLAGMLGPLRGIEPLPSGADGQSYRVTAGAGRFVAKLFAPDSQVLLGPGEQFALLGRLAAAGIAPKPAGLDEARRLLVTEFVEDAAAVGAGELRRPERIGRIAGLLKALHRVPADIPAFAPARYAERYVDRLGGLERLAARDRKRYDELKELAVDLDFRSTCLCHNDLTADNLLLGVRPKLIDFDYAVIAPASVDLASLVVMNGFSSREESALLAAYFEGAGSPFSLPEFARVQRLVRLLAHFWSLASRRAEAAIVAQYRIEDD
jgi:Ser/Thr protein kinase RdoA (MazF antagonist)